MSVGVNGGLGYIRCTGRYDNISFIINSIIFIFFFSPKIGLVLKGLTLRVFSFPAKSGRYRGT